MPMDMMDRRKDAHRCACACGVWKEHLWKKKVLEESIIVREKNHSMLASSICLFQCKFLNNHSCIIVKELFPLMQFYSNINWLEVAELSKGRPAIFAVVRPFPSVHSHVSLQIGLLLERLVAKLALERTETWNACFKSCISTAIKFISKQLHLKFKEDHLKNRVKRWNLFARVI